MMQAARPDGRTGKPSVGIRGIGGGLGQHCDRGGNGRQYEPEA